MSTELSFHIRPFFYSNSLVFVLAATEQLLLFRDVGYQVMHIDCSLPEERLVLAAEIPEIMIGDRARDFRLPTTPPCTSSSVIISFITNSHSFTLFTSQNLGDLVRKKYILDLEAFTIKTEWEHYSLDDTQPILFTTTKTGTDYILDVWMINLDDRTASRDTLPLLHEATIALPLKFNVLDVQKNGPHTAVRLCTWPEGRTEYHSLIFNAKTLSTHLIGIVPGIMKHVSSFAVSREQVFSWKRAPTRIFLSIVGTKDVEQIDFEGKIPMLPGTSETVRKLFT